MYNSELGEVAAGEEMVRCNKATNPNTMILQGPSCSCQCGNDNSQSQHRNQGRTLSLLPGGWHLLGMGVVSLKSTSLGRTAKLSSADYHSHLWLDMFWTHVTIPTCLSKRVLHPFLADNATLGIPANRHPVPAEVTNMASKLRTSPNSSSKQ